MYAVIDIVVCTRYNAERHCTKAMEARDERGQFAPKLGEKKQRCDFRLTPYAIAFLETLKKDYECSKTDIIEKFCRGEFDKQTMLTNIDEFIEYQRSKYGKNNAQKGEFSTDNPRWHYLNEFKRWIEDKC